MSETIVSIREAYQMVVKELGVWTKRSLDLAAELKQKSWELEQARGMSDLFLSTQRALNEARADNDGLRLSLQAAQWDLRSLQQHRERIVDNAKDLTLELNKARAAIKKYEHEALLARRRPDLIRGQAEVIKRLRQEIVALKNNQYPWYREVRGVDEFILEASELKTFQDEFVPDPSKALMQRETAGRLKEILDRLTPQQRIVVWLKEMNDHSFVDIVEIVRREHQPIFSSSISVARVRQYYEKGMRRLRHPMVRALLREYVEDERQQRKADEEGISS